MRGKNQAARIAAMHQRIRARHAEGWTREAIARAEDRSAPVIGYHAKRLGLVWKMGRPRK